MVKKIDQLYQWIETIITAILGILSGYFIYEVQMASNHKWFLVIIAVILIVLIEKVLHMIFSKIVNSSKLLRRLVLREHFIEGKWFGKVINTGENKELYGYSIVTIDYSDQGYEVKGKVFDIHSQSFTGGFSSNDSHYYSEEQIFTYYFTGFNLYDGSSNDIVGKTHLKVVESSIFPIEFMGTVFDTKNKNELNISLLKISDDELEKFNVSTKKGFMSLIEHVGE